MNRLFIGIEGGATKTEGVLIDEMGKIYVTASLGPSNPWVSERQTIVVFLHNHFDFFVLKKVIGFDNVAKLLKSLIDDLLAKGQVDWKQIISVVS